MALESTPGDFCEYRNHRRDSAGLRSAKRFFCSSIDRRARAWRAQEPQAPPGEPVLIVPIRYIIYWVTSTSGLLSVTFLGVYPPQKTQNPILLTHRIRYIHRQPFALPFCSFVYYSLSKQVKVTRFAPTRRSLEQSTTKVRRRQGHSLMTGYIHDTRMPLPSSLIYI